jgi:hypothetical protein
MAAETKDYSIPMQGDSAIYDTESGEGRCESVNDLPALERSFLDARLWIEEAIAR